jgi:hypothetical protein
VASDERRGTPVPIREVVILPLTIMATVIPLGLSYYFTNLIAILDGEFINTLFFYLIYSLNQALSIVVAPRVCD